MKKRFSTFIAVFALASLLTCIPDINNGFAIQAVSEVPEEVTIGTEINVEMIDIEYHGETKKASSLTVYTPTGAKINSSKIKFSEAGKYVFEFCKDEIIYCEHKKPLVGLPKGFDKDWICEPTLKRWHKPLKVIWNYKK